MLDYIDTIRIWFSDGKIFEITPINLGNKRLLHVHESKSNMIPYTIEFEKDTTLQELLDLCVTSHERMYNTSVKVTYCSISTKVHESHFYTLSKINITDNTTINTKDRWNFVEHSRCNKQQVLWQVSEDMISLCLDKEEAYV